MGQLSTFRANVYAIGPAMGHSGPSKEPDEGPLSVVWNKGVPIPGVRGISIYMRSNRQDRPHTRVTWRP